MTVSATIVIDWAMMILLSIVSLSIFDSFLFYGYPEGAGAFAPPAHLAFIATMRAAILDIIGTMIVLTM